MATDDPRRAFAIAVVDQLAGAGFRALWAGGCVRDLILGLDPSDYDVATDARPEAVMGLFRRVVPVGVSFGVVRVLGPEGAGEVEVATFRSDGQYLDGRRPESVRFGDARLDAERRDFTINGMFCDPRSGEILDYVGGRADLAAGTLRAIGHPADRFAEDKLRLLRAVRFAARFGLAVDPATAEAIRAMAGEIRVVAAERIAQELRRMLVHRSRSFAMRLAMDAGLLTAIFPAIGPGDRWDRTLATLDALPEPPSFPLALAALLLAALDADAPGAEVAREVGRDLKLANADRDRAGWILDHRRALIDPSALPSSRLKRILAEPGADDLIALHRAIAYATTGDASHVEFCEAYLRDEPAGPIRPDPLLTGHDLGRAGFRPGPKFKAWLDLAYDAQLDGFVATKDEALRYLAEREAGPSPGPS